MIKLILRVALLSLALLLSLAGSLNLNRASAQPQPIDDGDCYSCLGGPFFCRTGPVGHRCFTEYPLGD